MADNIFVKGKKIAAAALILLTREVKAPALFVHRFGITDFKGAEGDVVNVKRPPILRARDKGWRNNNAIVVDNLVNTTIQVKLNQHPYSAVALSSEEATLDEVNYIKDVQVPQVRALLEWFEDAVIAPLRTALFVLGVTFNPASASATESDPRKVAVRARALFQKQHVPTSGRYWLVGANVSEAIAGHDKLLDVDVSGLPEALRDGVVGKLGGFVIIELDALGEDESYFVHETAVAIAAVAPVVPQGAKGGGVAAGQGLSVTQVWDYDGSLMKDRSVVHAFTGATTVTDPQTDPDTGLILLDADDEPLLEFVRAIKVTFGAGVTAEKATFNLAISGAPTGGTYTLSVDGVPTDALPFNASNAVIAAAINELDGVAGAKVTGTATAKVVKFDERLVLAVSATALTGGTAPAVTATGV